MYKRWTGKYTGLQQAGIKENGCMWLNDQNVLLYELYHCVISSHFLCSCQLIFVSFVSAFLRVHNLECFPFAFGAIHEPRNNANTYTHFSVWCKFIERRIKPCQTLAQNENDKVDKSSQFMHCKVSCVGGCQWFWK